MSTHSGTTDHPIRTISIDQQKYVVSLRVTFDGIEYIGRLIFTDESTGIFYQDHGGVPGTSVADAVHKAKQFTDSQLEQRCHRALAEKRRFGKLRRTTDEMINKIRQLNRLAVGLEKGTVERDAGDKQLGAIQNELIEIVRRLKLHAGVEDM